MNSCSNNNLFDNTVRSEWLLDFKKIKDDKNYQYRASTIKLYRKLWTLTLLSVIPALSSLALLIVTLIMGLQTIAIENNEFYSTIYLIETPGKIPSLSYNWAFFAPMICIFNLLCISLLSARIYSYISFHPKKNLQNPMYQYGKINFDTRQYWKHSIWIIMYATILWIIGNVAIGLLFIEPHINTDNLVYTIQGIFSIKKPISLYYGLMDGYAYCNIITTTFAALCMPLTLIILFIGGKWHHKYCIPYIEAMIQLYYQCSNTR